MPLTPADLEAIAEVVAAVRHGWLPPYLLGQQLSWIFNTVITLSGQSIQVANADANRVLLWMSVTTIGQVAISPQGITNDTLGLQISGPGPGIILTVNQHGTLPQLAWFGTPSGASLTVAVMQLIWSPPPGAK